METNERVLQLIEENKNYKIRLEKLTQELNAIKDKELTAFIIGDAPSDGIYMIDSNGIITAVNKAFTKMTGISEKDAIGQDADVMFGNSLGTKNIATLCMGTKALAEKKKISNVATINNQKIVITSSPTFNEWGEITQVLTVLRDVTELLRMQGQLEYSEKLTERYKNELNYFRQKEAQQSGLLGKSHAMNQVRDIIHQVAQTDVTVLIMGETGVGKEVIANEVYKNSPRKGLPYIKVNCAAIPDTLLESELFGYEKGSFTGALNKDKLGLFEIANTGTLLLDEIGEMPFNLQSKLLRVLQEKEITRIGGSRSIKLDVRIIAATNQKLEEQVASGKFRQDLYYRLNVVAIKVPPLRTRQEDIPILAKYFLDKSNEKYKINKRIERSALELMQSYEWPGNVRELENSIEHLVIINNEPVIESSHILQIVNSKNLSSVYLDNTNLTLKEAVNTVERQLIERTLKTHGSTHKAARVLGVSQPTVFRKMRELGIKH